MPNPSRTTRRLWSSLPIRHKVVPSLLSFDSLSTDLPSSFHPFWIGTFEVCLLRIAGVGHVSESTKDTKRKSMKNAKTERSNAKNCKNDKSLRNCVLLENIVLRFGGEYECSIFAVASITNIFVFDFQFYKRKKFKKGEFVQITNFLNQFPVIFFKCENLTLLKYSILAFAIVPVANSFV